METELSLRKRLEGLAESSRCDSAEFWAPPVAPIETSPPAANAKASLRVRALYTDENDAPQLSQHTDVPSQRSVGSDRKLITGIAVVLALGLSALAYFFWASPSEKTTTQTAELPPSVPYPPATPAEAALSAAPAAAPSAAPATAAPSAAPAAVTASAAPAVVTASAAPAVVTANAAPEPVQ